MQFEMDTCGIVNAPPETWSILGFGFLIRIRTEKMVIITKTNTGFISIRMIYLYYAMNLMKMRHALIQIHSHSQMKPEMQRLRQILKVNLRCATSCINWKSKWSVLHGAGDLFTYQLTQKKKQTTNKQYLKKSVSLSVRPNTIWHIQFHLWTIEPDWNATVRARALSVLVRVCLSLPISTVEWCVWIIFWLNTTSFSPLYDSS